MIKTILGTKLGSSQKFTATGERIPVTRIRTGPCWVAQIKNEAKDGYNALQLGLGDKKAPLFISEVKFEQLPEIKPGQQINPSEIFKPGDEVRVTGWSKGKGFMGVVKRWHFKGGPRTHGQSDRERAPGSIGQTTTPGRVYKGKHMAGRTGGARVTASGLTVIGLTDNILEIKGLIPGSQKGFLIINKVNA